MLGLTRQERQVILFLLTIALLGTGVIFFLNTHSRIKFIPCLDENPGRLDLNRADKAALMGLRGIGEKLAQRIIEYRQSHAGFRRVDELTCINGITGYRYEKLKDLFFVE